MKTNNLVTVEYGWPYFGVGSEVVSGVIEGEFSEKITLNINLNMNVI